MEKNAPSAENARIELTPLDTSWIMTESEMAKYFNDLRNEIKILRSYARDPVEVDKREHLYEQIISKVLAENGFQKNAALQCQDPNFEDILLTVIRRLFSRSAQEDLRLVQADVARLRKELKQRSIGARKINICVLLQVLCSLAAVAWQDLVGKLKPLTRLWR